MKNLFAIVTISFLTISIAQSQTASLDNSLVDYELRSIENPTTKKLDMNSFVTIFNQVATRLQDDIYYPKSAFDYGVEGTVIIEFIYDGEVTNLKVVNSVGAGCDKVALKSLENFAKYFNECTELEITPTKLSIPFNFKLEM